MVGCGSEEAAGQGAVEEQGEASPSAGVGASTATGEGPLGTAVEMRLKGERERKMGQRGARLERALGGAEWGAGGGRNGAFQIVLP